MSNPALGALRCPHCRSAFEPGAGALVCAHGHVFDIARQGYVNLLTRPAPRGADTADMVRARDEFLGRGHYAAVVDGLVEAVDALVPAPGLVLDVGGGTGHYSAAVLDRRPDAPGVVLDISKFAARRAAKAHPRLTAVVADAWQEFPVADAAAGLVLNVFAPRNGGELRRVLRPEGALVVVTPDGEHLRELIGPLGLLSVDERKDSRVAEQLDPHFTPLRRTRVRTEVRLDRDAVRQVVAMGPNAWHHDSRGLDNLVSGLPDVVVVTVSVSVATYRPRP
ncbi:putative RNA methyltransferase [Actinosynnema sp. NPDC020468]|uniref:putative RNA methyltransferase n=1 Tax=Actinosynnema sp. NPDC020468 TaxID=3154488 RepID=UPI0033DCB34F